MKQWKKTTKCLMTKTEIAKQLGIRILNGQWNIHMGLIYRALVWEIIGLMITLLFTVYMSGIIAAQASYRLHFKGSGIAQQAFFASSYNSVYDATAVQSVSFCIFIHCIRAFISNC